MLIFRWNKPRKDSTVFLAWVWFVASPLNHLGVWPASFRWCAKITPEAVDLFRTALEGKLKASAWVSLAKTPAHIHRVPAREIFVEGHKLTIPEHFLAPIRFVVSDFSPQGEAGTLLPDIRVLFVGGQLPITAKILLDGKEIHVQSIKGGFQYRTALHPTSALSMGNHRVEAILTDASKEVASAS